MSINLFLRPLQDATVQYEYKTDVLSTYDNLEDRIAQRDIPRIFFNYNYAITDYKKAIDLDTELQKNGNVGSVWLPDWLSGTIVTNIIEGINTATVNKYVNLAEEQLVLLFADDNHYEVSQIRSITVNDNNTEIEFRSDNDYTKAYILPIYECFLEGDNQQSRINTLSNTFSVQAVVKSPVFSAIRPHDVQFLGHDVLCDNFKITNNEPDLTVSQQIQENDYEIGLKDRFTFFDRMYSSFAVTIMAKQSERDYVRNFIKRRWGKTYSCFIPSGIADFVKYDNGQQITNILNVVNSDFDFGARPFIAIYANNEVWYAKVVSANKGAEITTLTLDAHITHVILGENSVVQSTEEVSQLNIYPRDVECIHSLFFARFNDDTITFEIAGSSNDFEDVYSIEMPFIETEFYDADNINYDTVDGIVVDKDVLFEVKSFSDTTIPNNDNDNTYSTALVRSATFGTITGKYENTYAFDNLTIVDKEYLREGESASDRYLIGAEQDFCFQVECKFDSSLTNPSASLMCGSSGGRAFEIALTQANDGQYYPTVWFHFASSSNNKVTGNAIILSKFEGDLFDDWHEIAVQRTNGITYVYCDGYLNGSVNACKHEKMFVGNVINQYATNKRVEYICFGTSSYQTNSCGWVQQARLMVNKKVYTGSQMSIMNRVYNLFDYTLTQIEQMDNATLVKHSFLYDCLKGDWSFGQDSKSYETGMKFSDPNVYGEELCQHPMASAEYAITGNPADYMKWLITSTTRSGFARNVDYVDLSSYYFHLSLAKYRLPYKWYKDLWFEFEISKSGEVNDGQVLLYAENLMPTIYFSDNNSKWSVGGFGINPNNSQNSVWVDVAEHLNVALAIDSRNHRVCVYINGVLSLTDSLENVIKNNEHGCIGFYPLISEKLNLHLHKFRIVDSCLTQEDSYTVADLWKLGYRTTFFTFEFGIKQGDTYPTLRIINISTAHELSPLYDVITDVNHKTNYSYRWSDGSRADKIVNPTGNTLYTVTVTDNRTGDVGYGWFFVHKDFTGEICHSDMYCVDSYDEEGTAIHTNHFGMVRYDFNAQEYKDTSFWHTSQLKVVQEDNNYRLEKVNEYDMWDFFGDVNEDDFVSPSGSSAYPSYHRFEIDSYIKQFEFLIFPSTDSASSYYVLNNMAYYRDLDTPVRWGFATSFREDPTDPNNRNLVYGNYFNTLNANAIDVPYSRASAYTQWDYWYRDHWRILSSPKYAVYRQQNIVFNALSLNFASYSQGYYGYDNSYYPNTAYVTNETNYYTPIHVVVEPVIVPYYVPSSTTTGSGTVWVGLMYRNIWINGQKINFVDLFKNTTMPNQPENYTGNYFTGLTQNADDFRQSDLFNLVLGQNYVFINGVIPPCSRPVNNTAYFWFLKKYISGIAGAFGTQLHNRYTISGFACYDYIKYTENFDATEKLNHYH